MMLSYVSPQRPDLPARFESLNDDTLGLILKFVGNKSYKSFGVINKHCMNVYLNTNGMTKETFLFGYGSLADIIERANVRIERAIEDYDWELLYPVGKGVVFYNRKDVLDWILGEKNEPVLKVLCDVAAEEGRIDILNEVLDNVEDWDEDDRREVFRLVDYSAARCGQLYVLKWVELKGLVIDNYWCSTASARHGQLHILEWLQDEKGLQLFGRLYNYAVDGGQLHVLKWLREQEVSWGERTFRNAAQKGNLNILQWLHDEGCPWPDNDNLRVDNRVREEWVKPVIVEWLHENGYSDRIFF